MTNHFFTTPAFPSEWKGRRYFSLDAYVTKQYQEKLYKLPLNAGMTCPNRDGSLSTNGCIFCSEEGSGDFAGLKSLSITKQIDDSIQAISHKTKSTHFIAYFQAFTNTYAPISYLKEVFMEAIKHPNISVLSIATRPDCLPPDVLELLHSLNQIKPVWIELGLQTMHMQTHAMLNTKYSVQQFEASVLALYKLQIPVITHLILGLPGETKEMMLDSVKYIASLPIFGVKLQLLHVLQNTELAKLYKNNIFAVLTLEEYCQIIAECIAFLPSHMVIHRLTGDGPKDLLIAPLWSLNKRNVLNQIQKTLKEKNIWQGKFYKSLS